MIARLQTKSSKFRSRVWSCQLFDLKMLFCQKTVNRVRYSLYSGTYDLTISSVLDSLLTRVLPRNVDSRKMVLSD